MKILVLELDDFQGGPFLGEGTVVEVLHVGHGELVEGESMAPVAFENAIDDVALGAFAGLEVGVIFPELVKRVGWGVDICGRFIVVVSEVGRRESLVPVV